MKIQIITPKDYSLYIRNMRKAAELTSKELAFRLEVNPATLSSYERGISLPRNIEDFDDKLKKIIREEIRKNRAVLA